MENKFINDQEVLIRAVKELHEFTLNACELLGGSYEENLNGAINYFTFNDTHFKMIIEKV